MKTKIYRSAPLPFKGQKKNFMAEFTKVLDEIGRPTIFVDLFGGSGFLSHRTKRHFQDAKVIYNDYDNYCDRITNIDKTNALLDDLRAIVREVQPHKQVTGSIKDSVIKRIETEDSNGFVDWITVSTNILFPLRYCISFEDFLKYPIFNFIVRSNYTSDGYLDGLEVVHEDYKVLFDRYKDIPGVIFLVDPPYLFTDTKIYSSHENWRMKDYLDVINVLSKTNYIYFTSNRSGIIDLCEWVSGNFGVENPFKNAIMMTRKSRGYTIEYTDILAHANNFGR